MCLIQLAGWLPPPSHMVMKQKASHWPAVSEGLQLLEVLSRKRPPIPPLLRLISTSDDPRCPPGADEKHRTCETESFLHHRLCGKLLWWRQHPRASEWVSEQHSKKNIRSVVEKCVFLPLTFSERHMEAPICWLTGGITSALRYINISPSWRCEPITHIKHPSLNSQSIISGADLAF